MSTRSTGNKREHALERALWAFGYRTMCARASGQRIDPVGRENALPGDVLAVAPMDSGLPHLLVEVGGVSKRLGTAFAELHRQPLPPGFVAMVVRVVNLKRYYYVNEDERFTKLGDALDALRE